MFGPFVNRNHFAGYMAMLVPIPLALVTQILKGQQRLLYGFAAAIMATAAIVSNSRSGAISLTISMAFMLILGARLRRFRTIADSFRLAKVVPIVLIAVAVVAGVLWVGAGEVVEHFGDAATQLAASGTPDVGRATIWQGALNMIRHHSLLGVGFGAFVTVYPTYETRPLGVLVNYAHNDYLQVVAENGIIGGILTILFIASIFSALRRGVRSRDRLCAAMSLAAATGILAVLIQSLSDTDLQIPSNAFLFLILTAIVCRTAQPKVALIENPTV